MSFTPRSSTLKTLSRGTIFFNSIERNDRRFSRNVTVLEVFVIVGLLVFSAPAMWADEDGMLGTLHEYAPFSFWINAATFMDDPLM